LEPRSTAHRRRATRWRVARARRRAPISGPRAAGWAVVHECGHYAFSEHAALDDAVGFTLHKALLVPYFSWKHSHRRHQPTTPTRRPSNATRCSFHGAGPIVMVRRRNPRLHPCLLRRPCRCARRRVPALPDLQHHQQAGPMLGQPLRHLLCCCPSLAAVVLAEDNSNCANSHALVLSVQFVPTMSCNCL
jgi:hypothetical protein